jgi:3-phosphoshikimate 1-carboxyvinyltransferase
MLNSIAEGQATVRNFSPGEDCSSTMRIMRALGVNIRRSSTSDDTGDTLEIQGAGSDGLCEADGFLDAGNSGTTMRLMSGILAGRDFKATMTGDSSLRSRPMGRIIKPLSMMGAVIRGRENNTLAPLEFHGGDLTGIEYDLPVASAQLKSAILLAGLRAEGETQITQPAASRDHTERMLSAMGVDISVDGLNVKVAESDVNCVDVDVPGDISGASFWIVAGLIHPNAEVMVRRVGINPTRAGVITALQDMGANIELVDERDVAGEPVADIVATTSNLRGTELAGSIMPLLMDEVPVIAVAAAMAEEETVIHDAAELRVKETDRISATVDWLAAAGVEVEALDDGMAIMGAGRIAGGIYQSRDDHRIAMALGIAAMVSDGPITVKDASCASISYPQFWDELESLGGIID